MIRRLSSILVLLILFVLIFACGPAPDILAAPTSLKVVVSVGTGTYSDGSNVAGYNFTLRASGSTYGGDWKKVYVRVFDEHGVPIDADSISATQSATNIPLTRKGLGLYEGHYNIPMYSGTTGPTTKTINAKAVVGSVTGLGSAGINVNPWGCIDCHGQAYIYASFDPLLRPARAIDGVPPLAWQGSVCAGCHAGGKLQESMVDMGSTNWPYHAVDKDAWDAIPRPANSVLGFGLHAHGLTGHWDKNCTDCHESYLQGTAHSTTGCTGCHDSLTLSPPSGGQGTYQLTDVFNGPIRSSNSIQQVNKWYAINVPDGATTVTVTASWPGSKDFDIYLYGPTFASPYNANSLHRSWLDGYQGATLSNPERISVPTNGNSGTWMFSVDNYTDGNAWIDPLEPEDNLAALSVSITSNYPISSADMTYPDNCSKSGCHSGSLSWGREGKSLSHKYATTVGKLGNVECRFCHTDPHNLTVPSQICQGCHSSVAGHTMSDYATMSYTECGQCHGNDFHQMASVSGTDAVALGCSECHTVSDEAPADPLHWGYSATSNKCKQCHKVHRYTGSYKLVVGATTASDACDYCHVGVGAYTHGVVYDSAGDTATPTTVNNGHTISGSPISIPDNTATASTRLLCNDCHTVHGANAIEFHDGKRAILRSDPLGSGVSVPDTNTLYASAYSTRVAYCQTCHTSNKDDATHIMTGVNTSTAVAWVDSILCESCHIAKGTPHAAAQDGYKMLVGRDMSTLTLSTRLDDTCRRCHLDAESVLGVGISY